jgi:hypothetical protein
MDGQLLEAILKRIHGACEEGEECAHGYANAYEIRDIELIANILLDVHPQKPEKPDSIFVWYSSQAERMMFTFEYTDRSKNRDMNFDELQQYFCTVLKEI